MEKICKQVISLKTRLYTLCNLVFFVTLFSNCGDHSELNDITVLKEGEKSVAIFIPTELLPGLTNERLEEKIFIRLAGQPDNVLGEYQMSSDGVVFRPLIELTPAKDYQIIYQGRLLSLLSIPERLADGKTSLNGIYPVTDTVPENLLKIYLSFSRPMRQGVSENYLSILDSKGDTLKDIFLNLNTELWDEEGKQLTIWLDPGRIKRGLQPNERDGNPLHTGSMYTLVVSPEWTDLSGGKLEKGYSKKFVTIEKDIQSPDPVNWNMKLPKAGTREDLSISFRESLDHSLLLNTITIIRRDGESVKGKITVKDKETSLSFSPEQQWTAGIYYLKVDSRLEDLAGNNLNRLFDRDLLKDKPAGKDEFHTRQFIIN
ncbi:Ig-like domain-containing protein [Daejeonella lutea]|uniref:Ig-like domain-containing protein n=1 Tax=Daejeonella lutea TaxID=572036 RepID=A0A1T5A9B3_9SPHI|nr:Ig-like domain-containing protein [Daejeonella lutea]SKB31449.1 hypothetical protein SAMN05661099_0472 [Daejeonella lutea]